MKKLFFSLIICVIIFSFKSAAQFGGFTDKFEDGSFQLPSRSNNRNAPPFTIWNTVSPATYAMTETDGTLKIVYNKSAGTGAFDRITLKPPFAVNVRQNPHMQVRIKSSVATRLTLRPTYSLQPPTFEELHQEIPGDNQWHTYTLKLYKYLYDKFNVQTVDFFFDQGSQKASKGEIEIDDVKLGWSTIDVFNPQVSTSDGRSITISWNTNYPEYVKSFKLYRGSSPWFDVSEQNFIGNSTLPIYTDKDLNAYQLYYYRIIPINKEGEESLPSAAIRVETYDASASPMITAIKPNQTVVKKYEKFELALKFKNVGIHNPYDPEDIEVYAQFKSPDGKLIKINGFYDNYESVDLWKLRFSANTIGKWSYQVFVNDAGRVSEPKEGNFTVIASNHHGWIKPSTVNPHYFSHDDGTSYFALGVYSPWRNNEARFNTFAAHNANLFAIWDIGYGGFVNETGVIEEELGKYNQRKLGRIDSLLSILEGHGIQLMYAIWPHDLFSESVWATEWDKNPYGQFTKAVDVYADELAWEYQKKKYRYLIARFAHSRSMGIWELINEMNGTDGWKEGRHDAAYSWVEKTDQFFEKNDPYNHPVTASFSGGFYEYRKPLYEKNDIPNLHVYPAQGWHLKYPEDTIRSSMFNYAWASQRFWNEFEKPAIFGEAGADLAFYKRDEPEYHDSYHNAIWVTLTNGLAGIPIWWQFFHLSERDWDHLKYLAVFVEDIDFANNNFQPTTITSIDIDAFAMVSAQGGFGWARIVNRSDISKSKISLEIPDGNYNIAWFDTWQGKYVGHIAVRSKSNKVEFVVPSLNDERRDVAFKITKTD